MVRPLTLEALMAPLRNGGKRMHLPPVVGDVAAAAEPDPLEAPHIVEKLAQARCPRWPATQAVVQANRHQPGMRGPFRIEPVKGIPQVLKKITLPRI